MKLKNVQKAKNRLKVCQEGVKHEKYLMFTIINKTGKLNSLNQSICL